MRAKLNQFLDRKELIINYFLWEKKEIAFDKLIKFIKRNNS